MYISIFTLLILIIPHIYIWVRHQTYKQNQIFNTLFLFLM